MDGKLSRFESRLTHSGCLDELKKNMTAPGGKPDTVGYVVRSAEG
jgi:hypothetical protein